MKRCMLLAVAIVLLGVAGSAAATSYNCLPVEFLEQADHFRVHCADPGGGEGEYPRDGADRIEYFAVPKSDGDFSKRFVYIVETALTAGMVVQLQYTSGALSVGCNAHTCRKPWAFGLLAPATDVRIPHTVWPSGATQSIAQGTWMHYGPFSISAFRKLAITMSGTGSPDLYIRRDEPPTETQYTCHLSLSNLGGSVSINGPPDPTDPPDPSVETAVTYYVAVKGVRASNTYKLSVAITDKPEGAEPGKCLSP